MAQSVQKQLSPYKNQNLFSRHYLNKVLERETERTPFWDVDEEKLEEAFSELERIYEGEKDNLPERKSDEEGLRDKFISEILEKVLHFNHEKEKTSENDSTAPDYALYKNKELADKAVQEKKYYDYAIGLLEAKPWKANLNKKNKSGGAATQDNPINQAVGYLINNPPEWGILTNGKKWQLIHREQSLNLDTYYEVDIERFLDEERPRKERIEEFKYFYVFFRKEAFEGSKGEKILDEVLEESLQYAEEIGEDLEENIYQALEWIAKGYLNNSQNDGIEDEPIEKIHDNALILLYRLLFAHYADSRDILGDPSGPYEKRYNFSSFVDRVCKEIDEGDGYSNGGLLGPNLWEIFSLIDKGSKAKGIPEDEFEIPAYNGGLFKQENHQFFQKYNLHDEYLAKVIDLVARTDRGEEDGKSRVDYYDLSVRHLGGIYEGLLEYQLEKADEDMVEVKEDGDLQVKTAEEAEEEGDSFSDEDIIEEGQPYLVTDDGERKATGSYYTPDYIVNYIVENTVGPEVKEELEGLESDEEKAEAILDMQILDPAMGSAHFLVEVIDYLAKELVDYKEINIDEAKRMVARQCVYGVDVNPLATELGKLSIWLKTISEDKPLSFLDHHIKTGNSLIGADIHDINRHPEEDEDSERQVTLGEEFGEENAGVVRANVQKMLKKFKEIQEKQADSPEDIKEQEELYQDFLDFPFRKRFDVLADVYTSHYFDNDYKVDDHNRLLQAFKLQEQKEEGDEEWSQVIQEDWVQKATDSSDKDYKNNNLSAQEGFFHWKLEFPEVFFDIEEGIEKEDSGFDAVVGNPPYFTISGRGEKEATVYQSYLKRDKKWKEYYKTNTDIYYYFLIHNTNLLNQEGKLGFIVENYWFENDHADLTRKFILEECMLDQIVHFGELDIFSDASNDTAMCIWTKNKNKEKGNSFKAVNCLDQNSDKPMKERNRKLISKIRDRISEKEYVDNEIEIITKNQKDLDSERWKFSIHEDILEKLSLDNSDIRPLGTKYEGGMAEVGEGYKTGENDVFIVDDQTVDEYNLEQELLRKCARNGDIKPFLIEDRGKYLIYIDENVDINKYPNTLQYLEEHEKELKDRYQYENDQCKWYELSIPQNSTLFHNYNEKILCPYRDTNNSFAFDENNYHGVTDIYGIFPEDESISLYYLLGILNSKLMNFWYREAGKNKGQVNEYFTTPLSSIPIKEQKEDEKISHFAKKISKLKEAKYELFTVYAKLLSNSQFQFNETTSLSNFIKPQEDLKVFDPSKNIEKYNPDKKGVVKDVESKISGNHLRISVRLKGKQDFETLTKIFIDDKDILEYLSFSIDYYMKKNSNKRKYSSDEIFEVLSTIEIPVPDSRRFELITVFMKTVRARLKEIKSESDENYFNELTIDGIDEGISSSKQKLDKYVYSIYDLDESEKEIVEELISTKT